MALTGDGSQANPWVAQNYTDLQTAYSNLSNQGGTKYLEIDRDINCNDYGATFAWTKLSVGNTNNAMIFDLKGHAIENVAIASGNSMFEVGGGAQSVIKNGKILNVFMDQSNGFNSYTGGKYTCAKLQKVSVSVNITGVTQDVFDVAFDSCSIYAEGNATHRVFVLQENVGQKQINSDILLAVNSCSALYTGASGNCISNCRIRGKANVTGSALSETYAAFETCVFDLESNATVISGYSSGTASGVINTDKYLGMREGLTNVTSQEIINGDSLRSKNFVVVNVPAAGD